MKVTNSFQRIENNCAKTQNGMFLEANKNSNIKQRLESQIDKIKYNERNISYR